MALSCPTVLFLLSVVLCYGIAASNAQDVTIGFSMEEYEVMEGESVSVCVRLINGTIAENQTVVVNVTTEDGTAEAGTHYSALDSNLTFEASTTTEQCVTIATIYDESTLTDTQFTVRLSAADSAVSLSPDATNVTVLEVAPVNITSQPVSQTVNRNSTAMFTVVASGGGTITYQWQINDVDLNDTENEIVGATTGNLQVLNAQDADEGIYTCVVTNSANDFETSDPATLTVVVEPTITTQPADVPTALPNEMVNFTVVASGDPPTYQWFMINSEGVMMLIEGANQSTYTIGSVDEQDEGRYFCQVSNDAGSVNSTAAVLMLLPLPTVTAPEPLIVRLGEAATFTCLASPVVTFSWTVIDSNGMAVPNLNQMVDGNSSSITVTVSSTGEYQVTCTATNARGSVNGTTTLNAITIEVENVTAGITETAMFFCNVTGLTNASSVRYRWGQSRNRVIQATVLPNQIFANRVRGNDTNMLMIVNVGPLDGNYDFYCTVTDARSGMLIGRQTATLTTIGPEIIEGPVNQTLNANDTLVVNCTARNNPGATRMLMITWVFIQFGEMKLPKYISVTDTRVTQENLTSDTIVSTLRIEKAAPSDGGMYGCHAYNRELGDAVIENATVTVFFTPLLMFEDQTVRTQRMFTLKCMVTAQPPATFAEIVRFKGNETIVLETVNNTDMMREFSVTNISTADFNDDDGAVFQCIAINANGNATKNATLTVQATPSVINHNTEVSSQLASLDSVDVTWTIPSDNNAPITGYTLSLCQIGPDGNASCGTDNDFTVDLNNPPNNLVNVSSTQLRYSFGNVVPQQMYEVRIRAVNEVGLRGKPVEGDGHRFRSAVPADGQIANLSFIRTTTVIILTWDLPALAIATTGLNVSFNVSYFRNGSPEMIKSATVDNVEPLGFSANLSDAGGAEHTFRVIANYTSPILESSPVVMTNVATLEQGMALIPAEKVTETVGENTLSVTWPAPENTEFLTAYRVSYTRISRIGTSGRRRRQTNSPVTLPDIPSTASRSAALTFQPFTDYTVNVLAVYNPPPTNAEVTVMLLPTTNFSTPERPSGPPTSIRVVNSGILNIRVSWTPPTQPNGIIMGYEVRVTTSGAVAQSFPVDNLLTWTSVNNFLPNTNLTVEVRAINGGGGGIFSPSEIIKTSFGVSQPSIPTPVIGTADSPQFTIRYGPFSTAFGSLSTYQIVVIESSEDIDTKRLRKENLQPEDRTPNNYYVAFSGSVPPPDVQGSFIIGSGTATQHNGITYPNPPPSTDVDYRVFIRVYSGINATVFNDSDLTDVLRINTPLNPAVIIGPIAAVAAVLLIVLIVLLVVVYMFTRPNKGYIIAATGEDGVHRKKRGGGIELRRTRLFSPVLNVPVPDVFTSAGQPTTLVCEASGTPAPEVVWTQNNEQLDKERFIQLADSSLFVNDTDLKDEGAYIVTATNSAGTAEQMVRVTVIRPTPPDPDPEHPPIKVGEFTEKIALLRANDDEGLEDEYSEVEPDTTFTSYAAKININKNKNRYINIIPYDHSRVVLSLQDNTPGSDYINASYIDGFNRPNAYIATQGPQPSTFPDFWRMIWELDCPTVVMVTNLKEEDKLKCHQYWPSYGTTTYGNVQVTLKGVENLAEYSIRTFHVTPIAGQSKVQMPVREVKQFHFLVWPDHGVPQFATPLLSFRKRVAKYHPDKKGPMVVHCSAGVGRTGTFITIDTMLRQMEAEGVLDIFNFVRHMRFRRNYMVQTAPQYVFIHDALLEAIMCGDNSIPAPELKKRFQELIEVDPESNKPRIQLQFENLNSNSPQDDDFDTTIATLPDNMAKNRFKVHLPANDYRVPLGAPPPHSEAGDEEEDEEKEKEEPDYICASFADGYRQRNAFIITQAPMSSTTGDFWKMIWEQKSAAIVMLTELEEDEKEMSVKYWPGEVGEATLFGAFQLELSEDEKDKGDYVTRKFKLSHVDAPQECRIVTQFHFTKWPRSSVPASPNSVIDLIDEIQRVQRKSGNQPITIHCDDGISRTGAFCTLYSVLERVKVDQVVDVFLATKTLRIQRAGLLETLEQYIFIHKAVMVFLDSFSDYQNFK